MGTLGTQRIADLSLYFPPAGAWRADVLLDSGTLPAGTLVLTTGDLALAGVVEHADFDSANRPHAVVIGGLGWKGLVTKPISFQSDGGVRLSTVLAAVAKGAGQTIQQPTDATIGDYYEIVASRSNEPVHWYDVLNDLARGGYVAPWRVDPDGVTRFGARTPTAVTARATVLRKDAATRATFYGIDAPAQFLPGNTIDGVPIGAAHFRETRGKLEVEIRLPESAGGLPSVHELVRRQVALAMQDLLRTYTVATVAADGRCELSPPADAQHLPDLHNVEQWVMGAEKFTPLPGAECVVAFRDEKKTRPVIIGFRTPVGAGPFPPVARVGDTVQVFMPSPMPITGVITPPGSSFTGTLTVPAPALGTIQTGSTKIGAES